MKITRRQLKRIIREEKRKVLAEKRIRNIVRRKLVEARGAMFAADIQEPAVMADEMGMSLEEYIQLYIDAANKAGVKIVQNTPDMFTVQGPEDAIVEYGFQVNQMEGGPSFNEAEFREYAMYEV